MTSKTARLLKATGLLAAGGAAFAYGAFRKDLDTAMARIEADRQVLDTPDGPIEFAESGDGPAVLFIHGAGGGFDQGLELGRVLVGEDNRIIAPSRFGYLGTPMPADASVEAQADAHLRLLDALQLESVPVIGISAGAPSALQLCLRHPERCTALVLLVPMAWAPDRVETGRISPLFATVLDAIVASDFVYWTATKLARPALLETILGTPVDVYRKATRAERQNVDEMLRLILPIRKRAAGIRNDSVISSTLQRYALEDMHIATLVLSAADDLYGTYEPGLYTAEQIRYGEFVGFSTGGHLLVGHDAEVRARIRTFLGEHRPGRVERPAALFAG